MVENDGYVLTAKLQSWALICCIISTNKKPSSCLTQLECGAQLGPQEYGRVFNSFNRKRLKCILLVHFNHINQNRGRLKWLFPNRTTLDSWQLGRWLIEVQLQYVVQYVSSVSILLFHSLCCEEFSARFKSSWSHFRMFSLSKLFPSLSRQPLVTFVVS